MFKNQRFKHSAEVEKHLRDKGVGGVHYRDGHRSGTWYDIDKNEHLHVKDGKIGPAANIFIVSVLSCAGLLAFLLFVLPFLGG